MTSVRLFVKVQNFDKDLFIINLRKILFLYIFDFLIFKEINQWTLEIKI